MKKLQIWKFPLQGESIESIGMPAGAEVLTLQLQNNKPCIWAKVDIEAATNKRVFVIYGTGFPVADVRLFYISTYQLPNGLVFHVFELLP